MGDTNRLINEQILKQILPLIAIFIIALFCVTVFQGSEIFAGDQKIYLMSIKLNEHKENFLTSIFNYYDQSTMTIFDETITLTQKITGTDIYTAVFSILIITNFVFFWGIFKIAYFFTKNNYFSVLILLLFLSKTMLFGTSSADHDTILIPRLIGISLGILSIGFFLEAKTKRAVVSTIFCSLFHPITGAPITLFYLVLAIKRFIAKQKNSLHALIPMIFGIAGILFIYLFSFGKSASGIFEIIDFEWKQIMLSRTAYHFFFSWPILQYIYLSIFIFSFWLILILLKRNLSKDKKEFLFSGIITTALLVIISIILVDVFSAAFFSKMQLIRSLFIATILFKIILGALIFFEIKKNGKNLLLLAGLIILAGIIVISPTQKFFLIPLGIILVSFLIKIKTTNIPFQNSIKKLFIAILKNKLKVMILIEISLLLLILIFGNFNYTPKPSETIFEKCLWAEKNSDKNDVFLADDDFEYFCERTNYFSTKKGAQVGLDRNYAFEWARRKTESGNILLGKHTNEVKYIINDKNNLNQKLIYSSEKGFFIYQTK